MRAPRFLMALAASALLAACAPVQTTQSGLVGVSRPQYMTSLVSADDLDRQAASQYRQILDKAQAGKTLDPSQEQTRRVQGIARRLIDQVGVFRPDARGWNWEIHVIGDSQVNAWCMPGGKIAVYTGLLEQIRPTDDELAAVLGHEIAHALREHAREQVSQQMATGIGLSVLAALTGSQASADLGSTLTQVMFTLPNSRANETEADRMGVELAARAGYDPRAAISLWQKMAATGGGAPPEILSTHPSSASRIDDLRRAVDIVQPLYRPQAG